MKIIKLDFIEPNIIVPKSKKDTLDAFVGFRLHSELKLAGEVKANSQGLTLSEVLAELLRRYVA